MLRWAIEDENPVLFLEHKLLYGLTGEVPETAEIPDQISANVLREGTDVTLVGFSYVLGMALDAADQLQQDDISVEVIDIRSIKPLDMETILESVEKTGRIVIVEEGPKTGGVGAEIAAVVAERALPYLDGRVIRVAAADTPIPSSLELERAVLPDVDQIATACVDSLSWE